MKVLMISNYSEGVGGIAVQVRLLADKLRGEGLGCEIFSTKGSTLQRLTCPARLLRQGRAYDVFHIHACSYRGFFPAIVGVSVGRMLKKRTVLTYHGGDAKSFFDKHPRLVRRILGRTDCNIVLSGFLKEVFDSHGIPCTVVPNVIEPMKVEYRRSGGLRPDYICIRSFTPTYNIECLLKAFKTVKEQRGDATLTLVGDGPLGAELREYVQANDIQGVTFTGKVPNTEIYDYLAKASIMVSPSNFDNMPVSILEGFNAGLLVIASNVGGVPYMVTDGYNGYLFESGDPAALADTMLKALEADNAQEILDAATSSLKDYSWDRCKEKLMEIYSN